MVPGVLSVMIIGTYKMLMWSADSWDLIELSRGCVVLTIVFGMLNFL